jgi:hypothetical protein
MVYYLYNVVHFYGIPWFTVVYHYTLVTCTVVHHSVPCFYYGIPHVQRSVLLVYHGIFSLGQTRLINVINVFRLNQPCTILIKQSIAYKSNYILSFCLLNPNARRVKVRSGSPSNYSLCISKNLRNFSFLPISSVY